ncbi:ATP-dependent helicase [Micromonospora aurantiaca]|uniref:UvrD-helicase domain-containing protein n=1 Tax=Micromonospora aurantiaca (nom. illeg.) TaxID=47850 RepID=UPI000F3D8BBD|nr:ATP-dependent helicase [Micromonospora aurantiaca]RNH98869.1 ATP-dependent helicase [Micromonospora aurantiaca]
MNPGDDDIDDVSLFPRSTARLISATDWQPIGIEDLEPAAWSALRDTGNVAVVAGPGAGKTEFLAQRAAYLLQTGICPWPQRILAISFKRDAAANLGRRVVARVPGHAERFVSMTFDAFTKGLVDRFASALPADWKMTSPYDIYLPSTRDVRDFLGEVAPSAPGALRWQVAGFQPETFMADVIGAWDLPVALPVSAPVDAAAYAALAWWRDHYLRPGTAYLDFVMLNRLAELLVRAVPKLRRSLRLTYPFVFVDEFQDTTAAQFSFLASVFGEGPAVTVVGDRKQRIMGFAGALPNAPKHFTSSFGATPYTLSWNFRSSDPLVQLQHVIASKIDKDSTPAVSKAVAEPGNDPAVLWVFSDADREATFIADWIAHDIAHSQRTPADFALVARQKINQFEARFQDHLAARGIALRNDDAMVGKMRLQDLLKSEVAGLLLGLLRLAAQPRGLASVWRQVSATMSNLHGATGDGVALRQVGDNLTQTIGTLRAWLQNHPVEVTTADDAIGQVIGLVDEDVLRRYLKSATAGEDLDVVIDAFRARLAAVIGSCTDWQQTFDRFESPDAVVLLTAHRSKGLEYHTVFFLGLDDNQWWAHRQDPDGSTATFFVGLSRAAHRLIFTTTPHARGGGIAEFFAMLDEAGVPEVQQR